MNAHKRKPEDLRSQRWLVPENAPGFSHRSRFKQVGYRKEDFTGKPVIAIINTWSEINPAADCHLLLHCERKPGVDLLSAMRGG